MLAAEFPDIAALIPPDGPAALTEASQGSRSTWVEVSGGYAAAGGRVALVGDAAHSMTASIGEGCNCSLESAVALWEALPPSEGADGPPRPGALTEALLQYGRERPAVVREVQLRSAAASREMPVRS